MLSAFSMVRRSGPEMNRLTAAAFRSSAIIRMLYFGINGTGLSLYKSFVASFAVIKRLIADAMLAAECAH
jgi:hypothetical protein